MFLISELKLVYRSEDVGKPFESLLIRLKNKLTVLPLHETLALLGHDVTIIDNKFVMVRGLSQRYNNVWINNGAVPSSEADSRAFSFDIIPSSQMDNLTIIKVPLPELPADFAGGFIKISTKDVPDNNGFDISLGLSFNDQTVFQNFYSTKLSTSQYFGFSNSSKTMPGTFDSRLNNFNMNERTDATLNGFNNNLRIHSFKPFADLRLNASLVQKYKLSDGRFFAFIASLNYTNSNITRRNIQNNRYGVYDIAADAPVYTHKYTDNQYSNNVRLGAMLNLTYLASEDDKFEFKNMFNQLGNNIYRTRVGFQDVSSRYDQEMYEYLYTSRSTYSGQFTGTHKRNLHHIDWSVAYSYANRHQPDRVIINRMQDDITPGYIGMMAIDQNDIQREFSKLNENIMSANTNYKYDFVGHSFNPTIKAGLYGEYRTRNYKQRSFYYAFDDSNLPEDFRFIDDVNTLLSPEYLGADKMYVYERTDNTNSYSANNILGAAYVAANLPYRTFNAYVGLRAEYNYRVVTAYTHKNEFYQQNYIYPEFDLFPSANLTYKLNENNQLRLGYGSSINRPEFRELSTFSYYDFDLFSTIIGNPMLKSTYIQNLDFRYEYYPSPTELISAGLFYKYFNNPIEFTYTDAGGSYNYSFENAQKANSYGVEIELRKNLDFMGLKNFSLNINAAYIYSRVHFDDSSLNNNRPMQGQSPYLINAGLFYQNTDIGFSASLLYNRIGKRLIAIGRSSISGNSNNNIPDTYELARNGLDFNLSQSLPKGFEIKLSAKDLINNNVTYIQYLDLTAADGSKMNRQQVVRQYKPGRTYYLTLSYKL